MKSSRGLIILLVLLALTPTASGKEKPGKCPVPRPNLSLACEHFCSSDSECPGAKKCCYQSCKKACYDPVFGECISLGVESLESSHKKTHHGL
nr:PREDICTED: WAP four-disulfide core domain protein 18-like [Anolis carolinensis]|eukprot:XP_016852532.1 PREDICTED: WAP four-disulfide core domain protein 18-like [Anolis carolinensis]